MILGRLSGRAVLTLAGQDTFTFLQGLTTSDISVLNKSNNKLLGTLFLGSDGRILSDGLLCRHGDKFLVETGVGNVDNLSKLFLLRKVAAKIDYRVDPTCFVYGYVPRGLSFLLPAGADMTPVGNRAPKSSDYISNIALLNRRYTFNGPTDGVQDLTEVYRLHLALNGFGLPLVKEIKGLKILPQDMLLHKVGFVSHNKGCYVGQEIMNRVLNGTLTHKYKMRYVIRRDHVDAREDEAVQSPYFVACVLYRTLADQFGDAKAASIISNLVNGDVKENPNAEFDSSVVRVIYYSTGFGLALIPQRRTENRDVLIDGQEHVCLPVQLQLN
ncbi:putative transferase [Babesia sp. Xinjiang]|uniref:putative transferase n=1 Tax=Babesia sp. Xinjiang TaxID=462227 RepID=UPI000A22AD64|nr:putative transferase [Babesia sp. Xinjiang]ORM40452.1 putative transferase [Babesia sp. Xinjiang]